MNLNKLLKGCLLAGILFLFVGCGDEKTLANEMADPKNCEWYVVPNSEHNGGTKNKIDLYALRLYNDGRYVLCADLLFETGTWRFDEEKQLMVLGSKSNEGIELLRYIADKKEKNGGTVFRFYHQFPLVESEVIETVEVRAVSNQSNSDPYNTSLHEWRKKPAAAESTEQIKDRTRSYLRFLEALYVHAIDNNLQNPGGRWYPQPIKFFSNKVAMAYADELVDWYHCFYNETQGVEAYKFISGALMKVKITGDDDNARNLNCVRQLIGKL
jgi:hypothetical protein